MDNRYLKGQVSCRAVVYYLLLALSLMDLVYFILIKVGVKLPDILIANDIPAILILIFSALAFIVSSRFEGNTDLTINKYKLKFGFLIIMSLGLLCLFGSKGIDPLFWIGLSMVSVSLLLLYPEKNKKLSENNKPA